MVIYNAQGSERAMTSRWHDRLPAGVEVHGQDRDGFTFGAAMPLGEDGTWLGQCPDAADHRFKLFSTRRRLTWSGRSTARTAAVRVTCRTSSTATKTPVSPRPWKRSVSSTSTTLWTGCSATCSADCLGRRRGEAGVSRHRGSRPNGARTSLKMPTPRRPNVLHRHHQHADRE
jgi:hypothetical protein